MTAYCAVVAEVFWDLVLADEDFLAQQFSAVISATWGPSQQRARRTTATDHPGGGEREHHHAPHRRVGLHQANPRSPGGHQRSPPW